MTGIKLIDCIKIMSLLGELNRFTVIDNSTYTTLELVAGARFELTTFGL